MIILIIIISSTVMEHFEEKDERPLPKLESNSFNGINNIWLNNK